jgi:hypothetical protein
MEDARKLGERNWRKAARNKESWQKQLSFCQLELWLKKGCCANDDNDDKQLCFMLLI